MKTIDTVFWARVDKGAEDDCWNWKGSVMTAGYGRFMFNWETFSTHRFSWALANGPIPAGMLVCHRCDNPRCCNPKHMFLGTIADNQADKVAKGRQAKGEQMGSSVLTERQVVVARQRHYQLGESYNQIGRLMGVSGSAIRSAIMGKTWKHVSKTTKHER